MEIMVFFYDCQKCLCYCLLFLKNIFQIFCFFFFRKKTARDTFCTIWYSGEFIRYIANGHWQFAFIVFSFLFFFFWYKNKHGKTNWLVSVRKTKRRLLFCRNFFLISSSLIRFLSCRYIKCRPTWQSRCRNGFVNLTIR